MGARRHQTHDTSTVQEQYNNIGIGYIKDRLKIAGVG